MVTVPLKKNLSEVLYAFRKYAELHHAIIIFSLLFSIVAALSSASTVVPSWLIWVVFFFVFQLFREVKLGLFTKLGFVFIVTIAIFLLLGKQEREAAQKVFKKRFKDDKAFFLFIFEIYIGTILFMIGTWLFSLII